MDGGVARDATLHGGRKKYSCVKALMQRLLSLMVKVGWRVGKAFKSEESKVLGSVSCCCFEQIWRYVVYTMK